MKLRDHPLLIRKSGIASWPPEWRRVGRDDGIIRGEVGILEDASMHDFIRNKIFISMQHVAERYIAVLAFDDDIFAQQLYRLLLKNIGRSIEAVGDLDLSHTL